MRRRMIPLLALAGALCARPALAQLCVGVPLEAPNFLSVEYASVPLDEPALDGMTEVGLGYARAFGAGRALSGALRAFGAKGNIDPGSEAAAEQDVTRAGAHLAAVYDARLGGAGVSLCAGAGLSHASFEPAGAEATTRLAVPFTAGVALRIPLGSGVLAPYAAPTAAWVRRESAAGASESFRDLYLEAGAAGVFARIGLAAGVVLKNEAFFSEPRWFGRIGLLF